VSRHKANYLNKLPLSLSTGYDFDLDPSDCLFLVLPGPSRPTTHSGAIQLHTAITDGKNPENPSGWYGRQSRATGQVLVQKSLELGGPARYPDYRDLGWGCDYKH